jgi:hypothetical protein
MTLVNLFKELANEKYWEISSLRIEHCGKRKKEWAVKMRTQLHTMPFYGGCTGTICSLRLPPKCIEAVFAL